MADITGVINEFAHPPWGSLQRSLIGTFGTGGGLLMHLTRSFGPVGVDAFGLAWSFFTIPAGAGFTNGVNKTYYDRVLQVAPLYEDVGGHDFYSEIVDVHNDGLYFLWDQLFPKQIDVFVFPNYQVTLYWLLAL